MGLSGNVLRSEPVKIAFSRLMKIQTLCGARVPAPYRARSSLDSALLRKRLLQATGFSAHTLPVHYSVIDNRRLQPKTQEVGISLWEVRNFLIFLDGAQVQPFLGLARADIRPEGSGWKRLAFVPASQPITFNFWNLRIFTDG